MAHIQWNDSLETGIGMIDAQHRILVDLINRLEDAVGDEAVSETATSILYNLRQYTVYHFAAEETYMVRSGYKKLEQHQVLHQGFVNQLEGLEIDALTDAPELGVEMLEFLKKWLTEHIMEVDMDLAVKASC